MANLYSVVISENVVKDAVQSPRLVRPGETLLNAKHWTTMKAVQTYTADTSLSTTKKTLIGLSVQVVE